MGTWVCCLAGISKNAGGAEVANTDSDDVSGIEGKDASPPGAALHSVGRPLAISAFRRALILVSGGAAIAASMLSAAAFAQGDATDEDGINSAGLTIDIGTYWDSNVLRLSDDYAAIAGESKEDERIQLRARIDFTHELGLQEFFLAGSAGYDWYQENDFLDSERVDLTGGVRWRFGSRCDGVGSVQIFRGQTDLGDLLVPIQNTEDTNTFRLNGRCRVGYSWYPELGYIARNTENSAAARVQANNEIDVFRAGLTYGRTERAFVGFYIDQSEVRYPERLLAGSMEEYQADMSRYTFEAGKSVNPDLRGRIALGWANVETNEPADDDYDGVVSDASLFWRPGHRLSFAVSAGRDIESESAANAGYTVSDFADVTANYALTNAIDAELTVRSEKRDFRDPDPIISSQQSEDETTSVSLVSTYQINRTFELAVGGEWRDRDVNTGFRDYDATIVFISLGTRIGR